MHELKFEEKDEFQRASIAKGVAKRIGLSALTVKPKQDRVIVRVSTIGEFNDHNAKVGDIKQIFSKIGFPIIGTRKCKVKQVWMCDQDEGDVLNNKKNIDIDENTTTLNVGVTTSEKDILSKLWDYVTQGEELPVKTHIYGYMNGDCFGSRINPSVKEALEEMYRTYVEHNGE